MSEEVKYLKLARAAREEGNTEDAKKFYDLVRTENPENGEAKFFYQYYSLYEGKNGEIANRYKNLVNVLDSSIKFISQSDESEEEKLAVVKEIVHKYTPMTKSLNKYMNDLTIKVGDQKKRVLSNDVIRSASTSGVSGLYQLGDAIEKYFASSPEAMRLAIVPWKEGVALQQQGFTSSKSPEEYAGKIQKIDSSYQIPKKVNGCLAQLLGGKR